MGILSFLGKVYFSQENEMTIKNGWNVCITKYNRFTDEFLGVHVTNISSPKGPTQHFFHWCRFIFIELCIVFIHRLAQ